MRFGLRTLMVGVTLASVMMGAVAFLRTLSIHNDAERTIILATLFIIQSIPASLAGAFIGKRSGQRDTGIAFGLLAAFMGTIAIGVGYASIHLFE